MPTTIERRTPFGELDQIERRMRRLLLGFGFTPAFLPPADVYETPSELVLELEAPGFEEKELGIEVSDHTLTITGERVEHKEAEKTFRVQERLERAFERRFVLPAEADTEHVKAVFGNGVLEVHVPKLEVKGAHKVEITT